MTLAFAIAIYFVVWWIVLFAVLPFGITSQAESNDIAAGTEPGAPAVPGLLKKVVITTVIAAAILGLILVAAPFVEL